MFKYILISVALLCKISSLYAVKVVFRVDITGFSIDPNGVKLPGSFNGWTTNSTSLTRDGLGNTYYTILDLSSNTSYQFKFWNSVWETIPSSCQQSGGSGNRIVYVPDGVDTLILPIVAFNGCMPSNYSNLLSINAQSGSNGVITPSGASNYSYGTSQKYVFTPNPGYYLDSVMVDGNKVDSMTSYTFSNIISNHSLKVTFKEKYNYQLLNSNTPQSISFQAFARDQIGGTLSNKTIQVKFSLFTDSINGSVVYAESQSLSTNSMGLFTAEIGNGTKLYGSWNSINWAQNKKYLKTEINIGNGFVNMGTQQLLAVPFANFANSSYKIENANLPVFNTNAAAINAGLLPGQLYRTTTGVLQIVY